MTSAQGWRQVLPDRERLLWQGRPSAGLAIRDFLTIQMVFGIGFTAFAIFWMNVAVMMSRDAGFFDLFPLFGIPFVLAGLHMVVGIPLWDAYERRHSWYALTDQAAYIATEIFGRRKLSRYPVADMNALELEDGAEGTVWFNRDVQIHHRTRPSAGGGIRTPHTYVSTVRKGFRRIPSPRLVYGLILRQTTRTEDASA